MPLYESVVIVRQDVSTAQVDTLADELTAILGEGSGKVTKRENWGLRSLTYRIKKNRKAHYLFFNIDAPPAAVNEYERRMRINEDVLRYLTVAVESLEEGPSAIVQNKGRPEGERGERGGFGGGFGGRGGRDGGGGFGGPRRPRDDGERGGGGGGGGRFDSGRRPRGESSSMGDS
ncbi:MAG: 30S ribosomal protein S6 [Rhodospirillaceae bacterium]|nr:MAG: 30S ribosomal protein S6 [Rhodospirillaceae bacterium]